jgi:uncharacterized protein involved in exopolysaccharide biosynthesis
MHVMAREAWTDECLDDLTKHMAEGFREVRADLRQQREATAVEFTTLRKEFAELKSQGAKTEARIDGLTRAMQIWCWLIVSFLVGLMGMFAAQL